MAKFARLVVVLGASTEQFFKGLGKTEKRVAGFAKSMLKVTGIAAGIGAALAAAFSASRFVGSVRRAMEALDGLAKTSSLLGFQARNLAAYQLAAQKAGLGVSQFNMAAQRMVRRIAEAAKGTGEAQEAIKTLGLDAERLGKMSPERQLRAVADALAQVEGQGERVRLAFKLFDSEGVRMLNLLQQGSKALDDAEKRAAKLGLAVSNIQLAQLEEANDSVRDLATLLGSAARAIALSVGPLVTALSNAIIDLRTDGGDTLNFLIGMLAGMAKSVLKVTNLWDYMRVSVLGLRIAGESVILALVQGINWMLGKLADALDTMADLVRIAKALADFAGIEWASNLAGDIDSAVSKARAFAKAMDATGEQMAASLAATIAAQKDLVVAILTGPSTAEQLEQFFEKLYADAQERARRRFDQQINGDPEGALGGAEARAFQQFDPSKVGGFALGRTRQSVEDKTTHTLLREGIAKLNTGGAGIVGD